MATPTATITGSVTIGSIHVPMSGSMPTSKGAPLTMTYRHGAGNGASSRGTAAEVVAWLKSTLGFDLSSSIPPSLGTLSVQIESLSLDTNGTLEIRLEFGSLDDKKQWASQWSPVDALKSVFTMSGLKIEVKRPADSTAPSNW